MPDTSARLLRLLGLLQSRSAWPGAELAERLAVTERTVRRDVERLRGLGYPVDATPGRDGGYRLGVGANLPPLLLDDVEAVAVGVGLRMAASGGVAGLDEATLQALLKLDRVLPARLRSQMAALQAVVPLRQGAEREVGADTVLTVATACRDSVRLRFSYADRHGRDTERVVEPHQLVHTGRRWYLVGYDTDRADWRTFRVDRMRTPEPTGWRFRHADPPDAAEFVARAVTTAPYRYQARIQLHTSAWRAAEVITPAAGILTALADERCLLVAGADSLPGIVANLLYLNVDFDVLDPPELREYTRSAAARLARASAPADPGQENARNG